MPPPRLSYNVRLGFASWLAALISSAETCGYGQNRLPLPPASEQNSEGKMLHSHVSAVPYIVGADYFQDLSTSPEKTFYLRPIN